MRVANFAKIFMPLLAILLFGCENISFISRPTGFVEGGPSQLIHEVSEEDPDETAILTKDHYTDPAYLFLSPKLEFSGFDGKSVKRSSDEIRMLPGEHSVTFDYIVGDCPSLAGQALHQMMFYGSSGGGCEITTNVLVFEAQPGQNYKLNIKNAWRTQQFWAWIINKDTGQLVAGYMPPE